jgi:uncharacterized protein (TIGR01777 family)
MRIIVAGGSGFLGRALTTRLQERGDDVTILSRRPSALHHVAWNPDDARGTWSEQLATADAVVNLSGAPVDRGRWTDARKAELVRSRLGTTRTIVEALDHRHSRALLLNASAVGYYGSHGDEELTEATPAGQGFLASLCEEWEAEALKASPRRRVVLLRTGLVLDATSGALARLLLPFRLGVGGPLGSGRQFWPWIHREDWVRLVLFAIDDGRVHGPLNLTAPNPVSNRDFSRALGRVLRRPAILPAPSFVLRLLLGEMADAMVLGGQRAMPARAQALGFTFAFPDLEEALRSLVV